MAEPFDESPVEWGDGLTNMGMMHSPYNSIRYGRKLFGVGLKLENQMYMESGDMNDWHVVKLTSVDLKTFKWTNKAGVSWSLTIAARDHRGQPTSFNVGQDCPYFKNGYRTARVHFGNNGNLLGIDGPGHEPYQYVIDWSTDRQLEMPNVWNVGLLFE